MDTEGSDYTERLSRAVSLTVLELDVDRAALVPAYLLANLMSPTLWAWRKQRRVSTTTGRLLSTNRRLSDLQRQFHRYSFTRVPDRPGGDPWGLLDFTVEENRLGKAFIQQTRLDYDRMLRALLADNSDSQFGQIVTEKYYRDGYFPRLRNETIEIMNAYQGVSPDGRPSGKCTALAMLWAAALIVWGRFPPENVTIIGNHAHIFVFLDEGKGHLFNNTRWFSRTRIQNGSGLSEYVKVVTTGTTATFLYNPAWGMCHCNKLTSEIPALQLRNVFAKIHDYLTIPLMHPKPQEFNFDAPAPALLTPDRFETPEAYQAAVWSYAQAHPGSVYDFAQYSFRRLPVPHPEAYAMAALRDYHAQRLASDVRTAEDAASILGTIRDRECVFGSRERIALPDETLFFGIGDDREKALLLFALLYHSVARPKDLAVGFGKGGSYVLIDEQWLDHTGSTIPPPTADSSLLVFNERTSRLRG